jgi:acetyl-CoA carboxylase biotin carboxyl carrier protein
MELTNEDVADILALIDSLPYDELDLRTTRFRLTLRRTAAGWVESRQLHPDAPALRDEPTPQMRINPDMSVDAEGLVAVRAPLPGTFYRAPRPGAAPFVEVGSQVGEDTVVGIVETMKLMNPVPADTRGQVAAIRAGNAELVEAGSVLVLIKASTG